MKSSRKERHLASGALAALTMGLAFLQIQCVLLPEEGFSGERVPNRRPVASITGGVLQDSLDTEVSAHFYWFGADADGVITYFEWAVDDTISENAWTRTTEYDVEVFFTATTPNDQHNYSDWHTFYIRSVDDLRARSAPDHRYFNSQTIAPTTVITKPEPEIMATWAKTLKFSWIGEDLDATNADKLPAYYEVKLVLGAGVAPDDEVAVRRHFETSPNLLLNPSASDYPDSVDSEFLLQARRAWERLPGTVDHRWITFANTKKHFFAVRAVDEAGAREQEMRRAINWVDFTPTDRIIEVTISEPSLGVQNFNTPVFGEPWDVTVAAGQWIRFRWTGDASRSGTDPGPCNYGFDLSDPENPAELERATDGVGGWIGWAMRTQLSQPIRFTDEGATHYFYFKMRDISNNADTETQAVIKIKVASFDFSRKFLLVDDVRDGPRDRAGNWPNDEQQDAWRYRRWGDETWGIVAGLGHHLPGGELAGEFSIYGTDEVNPATKIDDSFLDVLGRYQNVIWDCSHADYTGFRKASNEMYLTTYVSNGGNMLLLLDNGPVFALNRDFRPTDPYRSPERADVIEDFKWTVYGFLYVQLHLRGSVWRPSANTDERRARESIVRATAANPLYPDLQFDFGRWDFGGHYPSALQSYECLYESSRDQSVIPWYEREEGLEVLYTTTTWRDRQDISGRPVAWRTFVTPEDRALGLDRGRIVCFAFHPYYFEPNSVKSAMTLAINWLATGYEY